MIPPLIEAVLACWPLAGQTMADDKVVKLEMVTALQAMMVTNLRFVPAGSSPPIATVQLGTEHGTVYLLPLSPQVATELLRVLQELPQSMRSLSSAGQDEPPSVQ